MSENAIRASGLGKQYRLGYRPRYKTFREAVARLVGAPWRRARSVPEEHFWALKDVSFEIKQGQAVGIIGRNGAGKSTLLKILAQITGPTEGIVHLWGRVGSLLEVGVGFHPELTGRENIYLNGALLGMKKAEIARKFDEIVAFAEVEKFLDTQVKHYSSGMFVRLGFSVAAHLETEILFVDEVLSVGDLAFQEKCLGKMQNVASSGRTVLFVSHNLLTVQTLCQRAIWIEQGQVAAEGTPASVISSYVQHVRSSVLEVSYPGWDQAPGNDFVRLHRAAVRPLPTPGSRSDCISVRTSVCIEFEFWNRKAGSNFEVWLNLFNQYGVLVFCTGTYDRQSRPEATLRFTGTIPGDLLNAGIYRIELMAMDKAFELLWNEPNLLTFEVEDSPDLRSRDFGDWPGAVRPNLHWRTEISAE